MHGKTARKADRRSLIAYVFQDIALIYTETPRECLEFSAYLRLPTAVKASKRQAYVDGMLTCLHLDNCKDTPVGSVMNKGLSGGEQKRVSIGIELVRNPRILFLDEPLSGLDSMNAYMVVRSLKLLAGSGIPVMMSIHQPSSDIFAMLDDIIVLHRGEVCYNGPTLGLTVHLDSMGHQCPVNYNPADFIMFMFGRLSHDEVRHLKDGWASSKEAAELCRGSDGHGSGGESASEEDDYDSDETSSSDLDALPSSWTKSALREGRARGFFEQLGALVARDIRMMRRVSGMVIYTNVVLLLVAVVYGWFFFRAGFNEDHPSKFPTNCSKGTYDLATCASLFSIHIAIVSMVALNMMFMSLGIAMDIVHKERAVLLRERAGGFYGIVPFFMSKCVFEVSMMAISTVVMVLGTYWMVSLRANFFVLVLEILLMAFASSSLMYVLSSAAKTREVAQTLSLVPQVLQFAFSGLLVPAQMVPPSLQWLKWGCPLFYGMGLICSSEFQYVFDAASECRSHNSTRSSPDGASCESWFQREDLLSFHDVKPDEGMFNVMMLVILSVGFRGCAIALLSRNTKFAV